MKALLLFLILIVGSSLTAQDSIARISYWSIYDQEYNYYYSTDSILDSIVELSNGFETIWKYSGDTLVAIDHGNYSESFQYIPDTIYCIQDNEITWKYDINDQNCYLNGGQFIWENGNCVEYLNTWYAAFYEEYKNPWFHSSKFFRRQESYGLRSGNVNLVQSKVYPGWEYFTMSVIESLGEWPTQIIYSYTNGSTTILIEYYDWIPVNIEENPPNHILPISTEYYDLLGRRISKPDQGFYIERKITDMGMISTKIFKQ
jgi:hypothetical protein